MHIPFLCFDYQYYAKLSHITAAAQDIEK